MTAAPFLTILDRVDSTNNYAMAKVHAGLARHGMAWFTLEQTAGKGQRGKPWEAEPGKNIALSLVLEPGNLPASQQFCLSAAVALACVEFFSRYAGDETKIKWPNDVYWRDRKAGGILIENVLQGRDWKYAVVGIGMNINQVKFGTDLKNPVSLKQVTGKEFDSHLLAEELYAVLLQKTSSLDSSSFETILSEYNQQLYALNKAVNLKKNDTVFESVIKEVNANGQLVTVDEVERVFDFGEVEWML